MSDKLAAVVAVDGIFVQISPIVVRDDYMDFSIHVSVRASHLSNLPGSVIEQKVADTIRAAWELYKDKHA